MGSTPIPHTMTTEEAQAKAKAYAMGHLKISLLPPRGVHVSKSGICDYCGRERPVLVQSKNQMYLVCWRDACLLKEVHGSEWENKMNNLLFNNRQRRLTNTINKDLEKGNKATALA